MRLLGIPSDEKRNPKAKDFWQNLGEKLGYKKDMIRTASAVEKPGNQLADGIQVHASRELHAGVNIPIFDAVVRKVADQDGSEYLRRTTMAVATLKEVHGMDIYSQDKVGTTEEYSRVKGALSHAQVALEQVAAVVSDDLQGHREKVAALEQAIGSLSETEIRNAPSYKTTLDQMSTSLNQYETMVRSAAPEMAGAEGPMGAFDSVGPQAPMAAAADAGREELGGILSQAYNSLSFAYSLGAFLVAQAESANAGAAVPEGLAGLAKAHARGMVRKASPEFQGTFDRLAIAPPGKEDVVKALKEDSSVENPYAVAWDQHNKEAAVRTAGSGDPGDAEPGNMIYTDINRCRDCVWFESDWTHDTYRDKCKNCTHASMGGTTDHWWPRHYQMTMWMPGWESLPAMRKARFHGSLSTLDSHRVGSGPSVEAIAKEVCAQCPEPTATRLAGAFMDVFRGPLSTQIAKVGGRVAARIAEITGIEFIIHKAQAKEWGFKGMDKIAEGEVLAARPCTLQDEMKDEKELKEKKAAAVTLEKQAKGEKAKIRRLQEQLDNAENPKKIRELTDAINALEDRVDKVRDRKEKRKEVREQKRRQNEEDTAAQASNEPEIPVLAGMLCLPRTAAKDKCSNPDCKCGEACDPSKDCPMTKKKEDKKASFKGTLSFADAKSRQNKKPKNYGNVRPTKPEKALSKTSSFEGSLSLRGLL